MTTTPAGRTGARSRPRAREQAERRREQILQGSATVLRRDGIGGATLEKVAAHLEMSPAALSDRFASIEELAQAIFEEVLKRLRANDERPWYGYGGGVRQSLAAARSFRDGYLLLVREAPRHEAFEGHVEALRRRACSRIRALLWFPDPAPPPDARPPLLDMAIAPMAAFAIEATAFWVERGDPARDELFIRWYGQTIKAWRHNAAELLNLDSPEVDWPFDTENSAPLVRPSRLRGSRPGG